MNIKIALENNFKVTKEPLLKMALDRIAELEAYNEKLLNSDIEKHNKIVELKKACHKWFKRWREAKKDALYFDSSLQKQIEATYKVVEKLNKAKEIFQEYIRINLLPPIERNFDDEVKLFKEAEEFLKEE